MLFSHKKLTLPSATEALAGRETRICTPEIHYVTNNPIIPPFPSHIHEASFAMGCFFFGEQKDFSGNKPVYTVLQWVMLEAIHPTRLTKNCVLV